MKYNFEGNEESPQRIQRQGIYLSGIADHIALINQRKSKKHLRKTICEQQTGRHAARMTAGFNTMIIS